MIDLVGPAIVYACCARQSQGRVVGLHAYWSQDDPRLVWLAGRRCLPEAKLTKELLVGLMAATMSRIP